jgi:hypothetical protein
VKLKGVLTIAAVYQAIMFLVIHLALTVAFIVAWQGTRRDEGRRGL